jgi:hypothetical protein
MKTTNKIRYVQGILGVIAAATIISCMILSCEQPDGPDIAPVGKGTVVLTASIGSAASTESVGATGSGGVQRTIIPAKPEFSSYDLVFTKTGIDPIEISDVPAGALAEGYVQALDAGDWTVKVSAYSEFTLKEGEAPTKYLAAESIEHLFTITAGENESVLATLKPIDIVPGTTATVPNGILSY